MGGTSSVLENLTLGLLEVLDHYECEHWSNRSVTVRWRIVAAP